MKRKFFNRPFSICLGFVITVFTISFPVSSQTKRYVKLTASGTANGSSWTNAFTDFQVALNSSSLGDTLFVSSGTYMPASGTSFSLKRGVKVFGGFAGTESSLSQRNWQTNVTILRGNGSRVITNINLDNFSNFDQNVPFTYFNQFLSYVPDYSTVLNGFTITNGADPYQGGGIYNMCSSPLIENCIIISNSTINSTIYDGGGGGMFNRESTPKIVNCTFKTNSANNSGGAVYNLNCHPLFIGCVFNGNSAALGWGGGAAAARKSYSGSIPGHLHFINCTFVGNTASYGSAYHGFQPAKIKNCIFYGNTGYSGQQIYQVASYPSIFEISNSLVQGTNISSLGTGNLSASTNPLFEDEANGIYSLQPNSPCINTGNNTVLQSGSTPDISSLVADVLNFGRKQGGALDMGAYELTYYYQSDSTQPAQNLSFTKNVTAVNLSHVAPGGTVLSYSISPALPAGLVLNTSTGSIIGTPTVLSASTKYTISIVKADGTTTSSINLAVIDTPPSNLAYSTPQVFTKGVAITSLTPTVAGGPVVSYSIAPTLPTGLSLNSTTGVISGTPSILSVATNYTITATNSGGSTTSVINIRVVDVPPTNLSYTTPNIFTNGTAISNLTPSVSGGTVVSYSISPSLPAGLSFNANTGVISGTPTILSPTTTYTIIATNTGGSTATTLSITVNEIPPANLVYHANNTFNVCIPISSLSPTVGGGAVVSYSISPSLPGGLSLNASTGVISGTPTTPTIATNYTITATNSVGSASAIITIVVLGAPNISYPAYTAPLVLTKDQPINYLIPTNTGGIVQSYSVSPALPTGLSINNNTGVISGTPSSALSATNFTVTATSCAGSSSRIMNIAVVESAPSNLSYPSPNIFTLNNAIVDLVPSFQGSAVSSFSVSPSLPSGLSINTSTGIISGTPTAVSSATNYVITATNSIGSTLDTISISVTSGMQAPSITYGSPVVYYVAQVISPLRPTNSGGAVQGLLTNFASGFSGANDIVSDASGNVFISDPVNRSIRLVVPNGTEYTVAALGSTSIPMSIALDAGNIYVVDAGTSEIKKIPSDWSVSVLDTWDVNFNFSRIESSINGTLFLFDEGFLRWHKRTAYNQYTPWLENSSIIKIDGSDNIYLNESGYSRILKVAPNWATTVLFEGVNDDVQIIHVDVSGSIFLWDPYTSKVTKVSSSGQSQLIGHVPSSSWSLTMDGNQVIYTLDNGVIKKYVPGFYSISPSLPSGLSFNTSTGEITGIPLEVSATTNYTVTATTAAGTVTSIVTITINNGTLPVTWKSFTAEKRGAEALLKWSTASEQNTKDFEVQHSTNTINWTPLGSVLAAGNSTTTRQYTFTHNTPFKGGVYNYYRILQRDLDGKFSYSKIASLIYDEPGPDVFVYPNPATGAVTVYLAESQDVRLINVAGATVWRGTLSAGRNQIPLTHLAKGVYWVVTANYKKQLLIQ